MSNLRMKVAIPSRYNGVLDSTKVEMRPLEEAMRESMQKMAKAVTV